MSSELRQGCLHRQMGLLDQPDDLQLLGGGVSHSSSPSPMVARTSGATIGDPRSCFFEQAVLYDEVGDVRRAILPLEGSLFLLALQRHRLRAEVFYLGARRLTGGIAGQATLDSLKKLLRPATVEARRLRRGNDPPDRFLILLSPRAGRARRCCPRRADPPARSEYSPRPNGACGCGGGCLSRSAPKVSLVSRLFAAIDPLDQSHNAPTLSHLRSSTTTMSQKASLTKSDQIAHRR